MSDIQKYVQVVKDLEFCDDFGKEPVLLARFTKDASTIAVLSLLGGFVAMAAIGFPGLIAIAFATLNDISYARSHDDDEKSPTAVDEAAIDIESQTVETIAQPDFEILENTNATRAKTESLTPPMLQPIANALDETVDKPIAPSLSNIVSPVWNPAQDLGENPQSALIVGVPGSGKGMLVSNAVRVLKSKYPDLSIFVIDPKADPKERGYWEGISDIYKAFSLMKCSDPDEGAEWLLGCMAQFTAIEGPKLCIFDELMSASTELSLANKELKALSRLKKFVVGLIGQGDSQGAWLWAMTQSPLVSDMGMSGGVRANLRAIGLVSPKNMAAVEALTSTKLIPPPPGGLNELRQLMDASPVNRAVFDGKLARWLPMPKLENYSGFDRDNRKIEREQPIAPSSDGPYAESIAGTWREDFAKNMPPNIDEAEFLRRYNLEKSLQESSSLETTYQSSSVPDIELEPVEKSHPLQDKFVRLETLLDGQESIGIRDISRAFTCKSDEAVQLAQMFCMSQKTRFKFSQITKPNGTVSKSIDRV